VVKTKSDRLCLLYLSITLCVFFSPIHHVLTFGRDDGRLVHAILGVRALPLFFGRQAYSQDRMDQTPIIIT
jgi:hypothetical protein